MKNLYKLILPVLAVALLGVSHAAEVTLKESSVTWEGSMPAKTHEGLIPVKSLQAAVNKSGKLTELRIILDMENLSVTDLKKEKDRKKLEGHLKSGDFFLVKDHPSATFELKEHKADILAGTPPAHGECKDPATTVAFIARVQDLCGLPVGIKLCLGRPKDFQDLVDAMIAAERFPDFITIDGAEGGTGAAPAAFMDSLGLPLFVALRHVQHILTRAGVRERLKIFASGKLIHPAKQIQALCLGADACCTARGFMLSLGCIQALQCNKNTCPVGITTHNPALQRGFIVEEKAKRVENYVHGIRHDFAQLVAATGVHCASELNENHLYIPQGHPVNVLFESGERT